MNPPSRRSNRRRDIVDPTCPGVAERCVGDDRFRIGKRGELVKRCVQANRLEVEYLDAVTRLHVGGDVPGHAEVDHQEPLGCGCHRGATGIQLVAAEHDPGRAGHDDIGRRDLGGKRFRVDRDQSVSLGERGAATGCRMNPDAARAAHAQCRQCCRGILTGPDQEHAGA